MLQYLKFGLILIYQLQLCLGNNEGVNNCQSQSLRFNLTQENKFSKQLFLNINKSIILNIFGGLHNLSIDLTTQVNSNLSNFVFINMEDRNQEFTLDYSDSKITIINKRNERMNSISITFMKGHEININYESTDNSTLHFLIDCPITTTKMTTTKMTTTEITTSEMTTSEISTTEVTTTKLETTTIKNLFPDSAKARKKLIIYTLSSILFVISLVGITALLFKRCTQRRRTPSNEQIHVNEIYGKTNYVDECVINDVYGGNNLFVK